MTCIKLTPAARKARATRRTGATAFYIGAAASVTANAYASQHTALGLLVGLWVPVAAVVSLEMVERIPAKGWAGVGRKIAIAVVATIALYLSYKHLAFVSAEAGAGAVDRWLMPLTVDLPMALGRVAMKQLPSPAPARRKPAAAKAAPVRKLKAV